MSDFAQPQEKAGLTRGNRTRILAMLVVAIVMTMGAVIYGSLAHAGAVYSTGGKAIGGYDPVAYFTHGKPVRGQAEHAFSWKGTTWHFSSQENRDAFAASPTRYAPRYGGYCAYAASQNYVYRTDPHAWTIVDDRLYLNANKSVRATWSQDIPGHIAAADKNWPALEKGL